MSLFFSPSGARAVCLRADADGGWGVETWRLDGTAVHRESLSRTGETVYTQPSILDDGRVLLVRSGAGQHEIVLLGEDGAEHRLGLLPARGLRLLPAGGDAMPALAVGNTHAGEAVVWRVFDRPLRIEPMPVQGIPALRGGGWLDLDGRQAAFSHADGVAMLDAGAATVTTVLDGAQLLLTQPCNGTMLVARKGLGGVELGLLTGGELNPMGEVGTGATGTATPLAIDPSGGRVAFGVDQGARSALVVYDGSEAHELAIPPGVLYRSARWTADGLRAGFSGPTTPLGVLATGPDLTRPTVLGAQDATRWCAPHLDWLDGPEGPIEAIVYGGADWRRARHLLIALHGGPEAAWRLGFDPFFQRLAAAGVAVVAPNQRGSVGYGRAHREATHGRWGGPDLTDVLHLARALHAARAGLPGTHLMLFGTSYGAFLALLAAAAEPGLWSRCAVIAPFLSTRGLYDAGSDAVRSLLDRLGALSNQDDRSEALAARITARLLLLHGTRDEVVPVSQGRGIRASLRAAGRREPDDFVFAEVTGGHDPLAGPQGPQCAERLVRFFSEGTPC